MSTYDNNGEDLGRVESRTIEEQEEASNTPSPTDTRNPMPRYDSTQEDGTPGSYQSTDTIRRRPHEQPIGYGSIQTSATPRLEHRPSEASTLASVQGRSLESSIGPARAPQAAKKPAFPRRASSNVQGPHRGQAFSVDDDVSEIDDGKASRPGAQTSATYGSGRMQTSTIRRRPTQIHTLPRVDSRDDEEEPAVRDSTQANAMQDNVDGADELDNGHSSDREETVRGEDEVVTGGEDDDEDLSDAESFTLKDRQQAINQTHPFGIRIWKPALYKKDRSVQKTAEGDIHSSPGANVSKWLLLFNVLWTLCFGWWLALIALVGAIVCFLAATSGAVAYGRVLYGLSGYLFYPFGKFVRLEQDEAYLEEDEGEGRSITEYEQWQSGDLEDGRLFFGPGDQATGHGSHSRSIVGRSRRSIDSGASETDSLLGRTRRGTRQATESPPRPKRRLFGRGQWTVGRVIFFLFFYGLITPGLLIVSGICWFLVFTVPMARVTWLLVDHLRRHPLALSFQADSDYSRGSNDPHSSILLCTYRAVGIKYWKYTIDGTNIFLINLMAIVVFVIFDYWVLDEGLGLKLTITHPAFLFLAALLSIIPLAYFIGQAVASISAQSSMGLGAAINAFFSTLVEVFLYCVALNQGKGQLVEGSIIGSIFAGILFLPGLSMCFGAIKRKTQRFNARSAGVTSTMLLFAMIGAFSPTLFYQIYGTHELNCLSCNDAETPFPSRECRRCYFSQVPALDDRFYLTVVRPYCWVAAISLFLAYSIGLWFTLRTHAAVIWNTDADEKKHLIEQHLVPSTSNQMSDSVSQIRPHKHMAHQFSQTDMSRGAEIRESQLYKRILGQSLKQVGLSPRGEECTTRYSSINSPIMDGNGSAQTPHLVPPKSAGGDSMRSDIQIPGFTEEQNHNLMREVAEMAATAAAVAARDASRSTRKASVIRHTHEPAQTNHRPPTIRNATATAVDTDEAAAAAEVLAGATGGGHDAPNWSRLKSSIILCGATVLYAMIAEILVNTVDVVLGEGAVDEKFLGITLFALVPNTTEFLNAISFAMNGNIALSMEIGSAYALQVCLLQIPALVLFSAVNGRMSDGSPGKLADYTFSLIFPQWDMVTVILCIFLLSYMYGEGKSNYFKGSILLLSYVVIVVGYWLSSRTDMEGMGMSRFDVMEAGGTFKSIGRGSSGPAFQTFH